MLQAAERIFPSLFLGLLAQQSTKQKARHEGVFGQGWNTPPLCTSALEYLRFLKIKGPSNRPQTVQPACNWALNGSELESA